MLEIHLLEQLAAFRKYGTLSAAAEHLLISQPALSRSMKRLEEQAGTRLFERKSNRLSLTRAGEITADYADRILAEETALMAALRGCGLSLHNISLGSCAPGPLLEYPCVLNRLFPGVSVTTEMNDEKDLLSGLREGRFNVIILSRPLEEDGLACVPCGSERLYLSVIPAHPAAVYAKRGVTFKEMNGTTFLMYGNIGIWDAITRRGMPDSKLLLQNDPDALLEIARTSTLPAFYTDLSMRVYPSGNESRVAVPFNDREAAVNYYALCRRCELDRFMPFFKRTKHIADTGSCVCG